MKSLYIFVLFVCCSSSHGQIVCNPGSYLLANTTCAECTTGYYCTGGAGSAKQPCSSGSYNDQTNQSDTSACILCHAGTFSATPGAESCTPCTAGTFCVQGSSTEVSCSLGQYSTSRSASCTLCPAGYSCADPAQPPQPCTNGNWSPAGRTICVDCPAGSECPTRDSTTLCPVGTSSASGVEDCTTCQPGYYASSQGQPVCTPCPAGSSCSNPSLPPVQCGPGYISSENATSCTLCPLDRISSVDHQSCLECPAGYECSDPTFGEIACVGGTYSLAGNATCTQCPAGFSCLSTALPPDPCPSNEYSPVGQTSCTLCAASFSCSTTSTTICAQGTYSALGDSTCQSCPAGSRCPAGSSTPIKCGSGSYSAPGAHECTSCLPGHYCPTSAQQLACASGTYSSGGLTTCLPCALGSTCISTASISGSSNCTLGQYYDSTTLSCVDCPAGSYCPSPDLPAQACTPGQYTETTGMYYCKDCPPGSKCPNLNQVPTTCDVGTYSTGGTDTCASCPAGSYCPYKNQAVVLPCPPGTYAVKDSSFCTVCPAGEKCTSTKTAGTPCSAGTYSLGASTTCTDCPAGYACPSTDTTGDIYQCKPGTYSTGGSPDCTPCTAGSACPFTDRSTIVACTPGFMSAGNRSSCVRCKAGYYCPNTNDETETPCDEGTYSFGGEEVCHNCDLGYYCPNTTVAPIACPPGYYADAVNSIECTACPAGKSCANPTASPTTCGIGTWASNASTVCHPCNPGYLCPTQSTSPNPPEYICNKGKYCDGTKEYDCPTGTYNPNNGSGSLADCIPCHVGYCCENPATVDPVADDLKCPPGHYCPTGTGTCTALPCPGGTYNPSTAATTLTDCTNNTCPAGYFCPTGTSDPVRECPEGFYCLEGQITAFENPCPPGTYGNQTGLKASSECPSCTSGHYCPWGSQTSPTTNPLPCPAGTYNPLTNASDVLSCVECDGGAVCEVPGLDGPSGDCAQGYYCPLGTISPTQFACPPGSFSNATDIHTADQCQPCPAGYYCTYGTSDFGPPNEPQPCKVGYYCLVGTPSKDRYPCLPGTYSNNSHNEKAEDCTVCDAGYYCVGGESAVTQPCPPGYYCPNGTVSKEQYACPNGTYNLNFSRTSLSDCLPCTQGHFCELATVNPVACPAGTYMPYGADSSTPPNVVGTPAGYASDCLVCPAGSICIDGSKDFKACGVGFYTEDGNSVCQKCLAGYYCDDVATSYQNMTSYKRCAAGQYCMEGLKSQADSKDCRAGYYCPEATPRELPCPTGTLNTLDAKESVLDCLPCTAGSFCLEASNMESGTCEAGYYCPTNITNTFLPSDLTHIGSYGPKQVPCPGGRYRNTTGGTMVDDCDVCPPGYYCPIGSIFPINCPQGYYCYENLDLPLPCPKGTYGTTNKLTNITECKDCDPGYYCDSLGMINVRGECDAGYICYGGASTSNPNDNSTGAVCPVGGYCPMGSWNATACPPGSFSNSPRQTDDSDCRPCTAGFYCANSAQPEPTGPCAEGHYCNQGSSSEFQNPCQPGTYCKQQSTSETPCPIGTYQPSEQSSKCRACIAGRTCPREGMNFTLSCPPGSYCPSPNPFVNFTYNETATDFVGTFKELGELCPPGSYNPQADSPTIASCLPCPVGKYCSSLGLRAPEGNCSAGYICYNGSNVNQPSQDNSTGEGVDVSVGQQCLPGKYCHEGTTLMEDCPPGTYRSTPGATSINDCTPCDPGKYCAASGMTEVSGPCEVGFYCTGGASDPKPLNLTTDGGTFCPTQNYCNCSDNGGCTEPTPCDTGLYTNATGQSECINCEPGFICIFNQPPKLCDAGYYCVGSEGTGPIAGRPLELLPKPCPPGTYSNRSGLKAASECTNCDAGKYCLGRGNNEPDGEVDGLYYSAGAAKTSQPISGDCVGADGVNYDCGVCQPGYFCRGGLGQMETCPAGTFGPSTPIQYSGQCIDCTPGYYCEEVGKSNATGKCSPGYYCNGSSEVPNPDISTAWGGECSVGHYCEEGSYQETPCDAGTFANTTGLSACYPCPAGNYCPQTSTNPQPCEPGYFCPSASTDYITNPCPRGTYSNTTGATSMDTCLPCIGGWYCKTAGSSQPTAECDVGWYCSGGSYEAKPSNATTGARCVAGEYCPAGSSAPFPCDPGMYCDLPERQAPAGNCTAGFYCTNSSLSATPSGTDDTGGPCIAGHYCPEGSSAGVACPPGTFVGGTGSQSIADCNECTEGKYCDAYGLPAPTNDCDAGYYCPQGQNMSAPPQYICWKGYSCIAGSKLPTPCGNGTYQDEEGMNSCKTCPPGYYCDASMGPVVTYNDTACQKGYYCLAGTSFFNQYPCNKGSYNPTIGAKSMDACTPCDGGHYCPNIAQSETRSSDICEAGYFCRTGATSSTPNQGTDGNTCPQGFYCPPSTTNPDPCPPGSYGTHQGLKTIDQCAACDQGFYCSEFNATTTTGPCMAGFYCPENSTKPNEIECEMGRYCPPSSYKPELCPEGTFSNITGLTDKFNCTQCTGGMYCETPGLDEPTGPCTPGYYCEPGSIFGQSNTTFCTAGTYCPGGNEQPLPCEDGTYVGWTHAEYCPPCPEGFTCTVADGKQVCPMGYYCPNGTGSNIQACPQGTFSNQTGLTNISDCQPCLAGHFCAQTAMIDTSGPCLPGYYCVTGMDRSQPDGTNSSYVDQGWCYDGQQRGYGGRCPVGHYCPSGTSYPKLCEAGSYADSVGHEVCDPCVAGYYCLAGTVNYTDTPCPSGHYCFDSTDSANKYPCNEGTFNNGTTKTTADGCTQCTGGWYCNSTGLSSPTNQCPDGYYCPEGSVSGTDNGCPVGSICPQGSIQPTICPAGYFCDSEFQSNVSGMCKAGWYCRLGAMQDNPEDGNVTGNFCPKGAFCPEGSGSPQLCPPGTYLDSVKNINSSNCKECRPGYYCDGHGLEEPTGECSGGFYCEGLPGQHISTATPSLYVCPQGHFCINGTIQPTRCLSGTYQDEFGKSECKQCEQGFFCDNTISPVIIYNISSICPLGHYCPPGTKYANEFPCPAGTFYNSTHATTVDDCIACIGGSFCDQPGLPWPTGQCDSGYFCTTRANSSSPFNSGNMYGECPVGHYCTSGSTTPVKCPPGTYNPSTHGTNISACLQCSAGSICVEAGMSTDGVPCTEGFYCPSGSSNASSLCPQGSYCPPGSNTPQLCPPGTWNDKYGLTNETSCMDCLAGFFCPRSGQTQVTDKCQEGYYCLVGQNGTFDNICPRGLHCPNGSALYQECMGGTYTDAEGQSECQTCLSGFYCQPVQPYNSTENIKECPEGYYCPAGTGSNTTWWQPCPSGTFNNMTGLSSEDQCSPCTEGYYCSGTANPAPTDLCSEGYYCTSGVDRPNPGNGTTSYLVTSQSNDNCSCCGGSNTGLGGICPKGYRCPRGSISPLECDAGTYAPSQGSATCKICEQGFFCPQRSYEYITNPCPSGHYCPPGTTHGVEYKCKAGTYNPIKMAVSINDCLPCKKGEYCSTDGLSGPDGNCSAGFYCSGNSTTATPVDSVEGSNCPAGFYCPQGSQAPISCPSGYYCPTSNMTIYTDLCSPGYYCYQNATVPKPNDTVTGWPCPAGHYCPAGVTTPIACPNGTFSASETNEVESDCDACTPGLVCSTNGLVAPDGICNASYYCPGGDKVGTSMPCEPGFHCPVQSPYQVPCKSGEYQNEPLAEVCKVCPEGFYCDATNASVIVPTPCPPGYFCPNGTEFGEKYPCPLGTFNNNTKSTRIGDCSQCLPKYACTEPGLVYPYIECSSGYFCKHSSNSSTPTLGPDIAGECPPGYYCPQGTDEPTPCPQGTFSSKPRLSNEGECTNCTAGFYCSPLAQLAPTAPCDPRFYCPPGSTNAQQVICPHGSYCGLQTSVPDPCPISTYSNTEGLANSTQCLECKAGYYCDQPGRTNVTGPCAPGYYCPNGSSSATEKPCWIGYKCPEGSPLPLSCGDGYYSDSPTSSSCQPCPGGQYCVASDVIPDDVTTLYKPCPRGYFCPNGTGVDYQPCPVGTYSNKEGLQFIEECLPCEPGYYCNDTALTSPTAQCYEGYYCQSGVQTPGPSGTLCDSIPGSIYPSVGDICPPGTFCIPGSSTPESCKAGFYNDITTQGACQLCEPGYYCPANTTTYIIYPCPEGHFCPRGTDAPYNNPCPAGTFNNVTNGQNETWCIPCTAGTYCDNLGNVVDGLPCDPGYYCPEASISSTGSPNGGECTVSHYCPVGSGSPVPCPAGQYCEHPQLSEPTGNCTKGYYCPPGSAKPQDPTWECEVGFYCPEGTPAPIPCGNGTYGLIGKSESPDQCQTCDAGKYCVGVGRTNVSGDCEAGYYCPAGSITPNDPTYRCQAGYKCPTGSPLPIQCNTGLYQKDPQKATCDDCPVGFYCPNAGAITTPTPCPQGHYCLLNTDSADKYPCPPGSYNNNTGSSSSSSCQPCWPGYFCTTPGQITGSGDGPCLAGYYCDAGSATSTQHICPQGSYCVENSALPQPCPAGTITKDSGNQNISDCESCDPGKYCSDTSGGMVDCLQGYVCTGGSDTPTPTDDIMGYICPSGFMCPNGTLTPKECIVGSYQPHAGQWTCDLCPEGSYCPNVNTTSPLPCPMGYYCGLGTAVPRACPDGTFSNKTDLKDSTQCVACPAGKFCKAPETNPYDGSKDCSEGYVCVTQSSSAANLVVDGFGNGPCPAGHYCPRGTPGALECPPGSLRAAQGARNITDCVPCPATKYCTGPAAVTFTGDCDAGFYCPSNAYIKDQQPSAYQCTRGHFCPPASSEPVPCPSGSYQPGVGATQCQACDAGYYCQTNTTTPVPCPVTSYCPENSSSPLKCPGGKYGVGEQLESPDDCLDCPRGFYCVDGNVSAPCSAGYLCISGSDSPTPDGSNPTVGGPCPFGYYCLEGTLDPQLCPEGLVINVVGASSKDNCTKCPAGFICTNSTVPVPCNPGYYCPFDEAITPCPPGTYSNTSGASDSSTCEPCLPGYWCPSPGTTNPTQTPCPVGHYCPLGTGSTPTSNTTLDPVPCQAGTYRDEVGGSSQADCSTCPPGYYCPYATTTCYNCTDSGVRGYPCPSGTYCKSGSVFYQPCEAEFYCPQSSVQLPCPEGNYCPGNSTSPTPCPAGHYCPTSSALPLKCPLGYYELDGSTRTTFATTCGACQPGTFGADENRQNCSACQAGVVCLTAATTDQPQANNATSNTTNSYPCPPGYYCPSSSIIPTPCPAGTYNPNEFGQDASATYCILCGVDQFNHLPGQTACLDCGGQASQPSMGQTTCVCTGSGQDFQPSDRQCPCADGYLIDETRGGDCVKYVYPICTTGTSRSQSGQCLTDEEWLIECTNTCGSEELSQGVDRSLGACTCAVDDLDSVCDLECRSNQQKIVQLICPNPVLGQEAYVRVTYTDGSIEDFPVSQLSKIINAPFSINDNQCTSGSGSIEPVYIMESTSVGVLGLYQPDAAYVAGLLQANSQQNTTQSSTSRRRRSIGNYENFGSFNYETTWNKRKLLAVSSVSNNTGITNPVVCLADNAVVMFTITNTEYPIYDTNNLYNTNDKFDYGGFRKLQEDVQLTGTTSSLFAFRFSDPGVYAFYLSTNTFKKFYVKVVSQGGTCTEVGPFFPPTPRYMTQSGLSLRTDILLEPDWLFIGLLLASAVIIILILVAALVLFQRYGWGRLKLLVPYYRVIATYFEFDDYSSKGSTVHSIKKYHPNLDLTNKAVVHQDQDAAVVGVGVDTKDEFWDYERQVDLESFSSQELYTILKKHSNHVTSSIGMQKEEVKLLYQKISQQIQVLKDFWTAKVNVFGKPKMSKDERKVYEERREELEMEIERRKHLGEKVMSVLVQQREIQHEDGEQRMNNFVQFTSLFKSVKRILMKTVEDIKEGNTNTDDLQADVSCVNDMINKISMVVSGECRRLGCWGVLGEGSGAQLIHPGTKSALLLSDIFNEDGTLKATDICVMDDVLKLAVPKPGCDLLMYNGQLISVVGKEYFVHPQTGRVLPIEGSLSFDPMSSQIVCTSDFATSDNSATTEALIPFIPFPTHRSTMLPMNVELPTISRRSDLRYGQPMVDPCTGLTVPICGVTINPLNGQIHPLGGTHTSPVTGLPTPIEIGSFMLLPNTNTPVPILMVGFDKEGKIIPIGGTMMTPDAPSSSSQTPILPGSSYIDPMSGKMMIAGSCRSLYIPGKDGKVIPSSGGYQSYLNASLLASQVKALDSLQQLKDSVLDLGGHDVSFNPQHEGMKVEASLKQLHTSHKMCLVNLIRTSVNMKQHEQRFSVLSATGGVAGIMEYNGTGQLLPILVGTNMDDPDGTKLTLPILGTHKDKISGLMRPLAGTMEHPDGLGLIPINLGVEGIDVVSGKTGKVTGAKVNMDSNTVMPIVQSGGQHQFKQRTPPIGAMVMLEDEIAARNGSWRKRRGWEKDVDGRMVELQKKLMVNPALEADEYFEAISDLIHQITNAVKKESERRESKLSELTSVLPSDVIAILTENDRNEKQRDEKSLANYNKMVNSSQWASHIEKQIQSMDLDLAEVEYSREVSESMASEARSLMKGLDLVYGECETLFVGSHENAQASGWNALTPLMQHLISLLESGMQFQLTPDLINALKNPQYGSKLHTQATNQPIASHPSMQMMHPHPAYAQPDQPIQAVGVLNKPQTHMATTQKVQIKESSIGLGRRDVIEIDGKLDPRVVEHEVLNQASVVDRADALVTPSGSDNVQEMLERHAMEVAKLENELRSDEIMKINEIISDIEQKKEVEVMKLKIELKEKLKKCSTDEEKEKVMMEYATKIHKVTEGLEQEKQTRLSDLRGKLARERQRRKKELFEKHKREAELAGLDPEKVVVDIAHESEEEVNKDLLLLAQQQEKLIAELQQAYADDGVDEGGEKKAKFDAEMEARIRALNEGRGVPVVSEEGVEEIVNIGGKINSLRANMKDKMKQRRAQRKTIRGSSQLPQEFGDDEQYTAEGQVYKANLSTLQLQEDEHMENMILSALEEAELEKCESQQLEVLRMKMLEGGVDENERDQIMAEFESANQVFKDKLSMQHKKQKEELLLRLKARKTLQEELSKEKAVMKQLQGVGKHDEGRKVEIDVATVVVAQQLEQQVEALSSLDQKHAVELNKLMDNLEDENNQEETKISSHFDEQCKLQAAAAVARAEQEAREGNLNEKRTAKLVKQYQAQAEAMNNSLLTQKKRQIEEMKQKLAQRKNNRKNQLMEQQKVEKDEVLLALKEDRDASASNKIKEAEKDCLDDVAKKSGGVSSMEAFIQDTLLPRHLLEMRNLMEKIKLEVEAGRKKAEIQATSERDEAREKLTQQQTDEVSQLLIAHAGEPANKVLKLKKKLEAKHKEELKKFDKDTNDVIASAVQSALTKVQINQSESKLKLRESHLRELSEALLEFNPEEMLKKQFADESSSAAQEVLAFREMKKREIDEKIKQLKKERMKVREEASAKLLEQQTSDDLDELKAKEMMTQQEAERKEREILASNLSSDEKEKLLNEHRMNVKRIEDKLQAEKSRTQKKLQEQLEERRKRRRELQSTSGSSVEYHKEVSEDERSLDGRDGKSEDGKIGDVGDGVGKIMIIDNTKVDGGNFMLPVMIQSFTQELEVLDTKLRSSFEKNRINGATTTPFIDINDAQWMMDGSLVTLETHKLAPNQYIVYKFGLFVAKMLKPVFEMDKDVSILIATCVPENKYDRNAFRRSFFYQHSSQTLYIRVDHLSSVGDFMMVVLHCFAHITVGQMDDDADPYFLRAFYKGLKIACEDLFFTRARFGGSGDSTTLSRVEGKDLSLSILDHLVDTDVITPTSDVFSTKAFLTRMMKYGNFQSSNTLTNMIKYKPTFQQQQSVTRRMLQLANPDRAKPIILQPGLVHTSLVPSTPHTVVQQQISRLNDKLDWYNHRLVACVENQNIIAEKQNNGDKDAEFYRNEIMKIETQREVLLKEMKIMELTIHEKQRALQ